MVDLNPILNILLMGFIIATGPLSWLWLRTRAGVSGVGEFTEVGSALAKELTARQRLLQLTQITLFLTFDLLLFGAFTRLTDSGLGCPDWPGCYGYTSPTGAASMIASAQALMPSGPVTHMKAWIEMIHRYLATSVGVLVLTMCLFTWVDKQFTAPRGKSLFILFWICLQGAFGAFTVTMRLFPAIVTLHLMGAVLLLIFLTDFLMEQRFLLNDCISKLTPSSAQTQLAEDSKGSEHGVLTPALETIAAALTRISVPTGPASSAAQDFRQLRRLLQSGLLLVLMQVLLGGWVSTNYAVTACDTFPQCQGSWWPAMNFAAGFEVWRPLGMSASAEILGFDALTAIHYAHRTFAYVVFLGIGVLSWRLIQFERFRSLGKLIAGLLVLQLVTGVSNAVLHWPLLSAVVHTGGAASLGILLTIGIKMCATNSKRQRSAWVHNDGLSADTPQHSKAGL